MLGISVIPFLDHLLGVKGGLEIRAGIYRVAKMKMMNE